MGRRKAELSRKERYARLIAAWRGVEMLVAHAFETPGPRWVRVESERDPEWDDIVEELEGADGQRILRGWQVKLQFKAFDAEMLAGMLRRLHVSRRLHRGCFALPSAVEVKGVGDLFALHELCRRASQPGCDPSALATTKDEKAWWRFLGKVARPLDKRLSLLRRMEVQFIREGEIELNAHLLLKHLFHSPTEPIFRSIESYFWSIDDARVVDAERLEKEALLSFASQRGPTPATLRTARARYLTEVQKDDERRTPLARLRTAFRVPLHEVRVPFRQLSGPIDHGARRSLRAWLQVLDGNERTLVVFGEVGSGKTELLALTAAELAADAEAGHDQPIPLLVDARTLIAGGLEQAARARWPAVSESVIRLLEAPKICWIVLLDGLDEAGPRGLDAASSLQRSLGNRLHALAITTRPSLRPSLPGALEVWLPPWTNEETAQFLVRWQDHDPEAVAALRRSPHRGSLATLCANPLTATFCLLVARHEPEALRSRASVYHAIVKYLFDAWAQARSELTGRASVRFRSVAPVLRRLALEVVRRERSTIPRQDVAALLRRETPDEEWTVKEALELDLGVLVYTPDDSYEFSIRGLAEHLAGQQLLEAGVSAVAAAALEPWSEEVCRQAIGWAALTERRLAISILEALLRDEKKDNIVFTNVHLRQVLVATQAAADLGEEAKPIVEKLSNACLRRLLDETSLWVGDRVAKATAELMLAGARCWEPLEQNCIKLACDDRPGRAAWYKAQGWDDPAVWIDLLHERDPEVRRVTVERLATWVDEPDVRRRLVLETLDDGFDIITSTPALAAAQALRLARRDDHFVEQRQQLLLHLKRGGQLGACAAAVALLPEEADPVLLAAALREGSTGHMFPPVIAEELARGEAGRSALQRVWPDWTEYAAKWRPACYPEPSSPGEGRQPASEPVRNRLIRAVAPALRGASVVQRVLDANLFAAPDTVCELAQDYPEIISPLLKLPSNDQIPLLSPAAQNTLGCAALIHSALRDQLLDLWESIGPRSGIKDHRMVVRQRYPGHALEPLIRQNDAGAINAYSEWLPNAPDLMIPRPDPTPLPPEILAPAPIRMAAQAHVDFVWGYATKGIVDGTTGKRSFLMSTTAGATLHCLWPVWHEDISLRSELHTWILNGDVNRFTAALHALEGLILPASTQDLIVQGIDRQIKAHGRQGGSLVTFVLPHVLRFVYRTGLTARLADLLRQLIEVRTPVTCHAAAVLVQQLAHEEAARISQTVAEGPWLAWQIEMIDTPLLRRMVELAPEAWASALERAICASRAPLMGLLLPFLDGLTPAGKGRVLLAWAGSLGAMELPWSSEGRYIGLSVRPADRVRQLLFDHGLDREAAVDAPGGNSA
ncbi:hypothetical protein WME91_27235 [Sorangium sp. So ce269]